MIEINNRNYDIQISLFCGTEKTAVDAAKTNKNAAYLHPTNITRLEITTSLLSPYFKGSFDYDDPNVYSYIRGIILNPFIYGHLTFAMVDPSEQVGKIENDSYVKNETFDETIIITGIDSIDASGNESKSNFRFSFVSVDFLNFTSTLQPYSVADKIPNGGDKLDSVLTSLFSKAYLDGKIDFSKNVPTVKVPFMTTCNSSLIDSLEYLYRKTFDCNIMVDNSTNGYFKIIYDHIDKKYKVWRFDSIGNNIFNDTPSPTKDSFAYINEKRVVNIDMSNNSAIGSGSGGTNKATIKFSGNSFDIMNVLSDRKHYDFDYLKNNFDDNIKDVKNFWKNHIHSNYKPDKFAIKTSLFENAKLNKDLKFNTCHSRYHENASVYDMYNEMIFGSTYMHVEASGIISRKAGDLVLLHFIDEPSSPYNKLRGDYFITSHRNIYTKNDESYDNKATFRTVMECFSPYIQTESNSESSNWTWS